MLRVVAVMTIASGFFQVFMEEDQPPETPHRRSSLHCFLLRCECVRDVARPGLSNPVAGRLELLFVVYTQFP